MEPANSQREQANTEFPIIPERSHADDAWRNQPRISPPTHLLARPSSFISHPFHFRPQPSYRKWGAACYTGLALRRGFIQAGAQSLLLTLWSIDDEKVAGFMPEFYAAVHRTGDIPRALSEVQRGWLKELREKDGVSQACRLAGPFILSFQERPNLTQTTALRN